MTEPSYYYIVNEILLNWNIEKLVSSTEFRAPEESLSECKKNAGQFYDNKKNRVEYWMMLGTYEIATYQKFELNITLVEIKEGVKTEYIVKSINKNILPGNLSYEQRVLSQYPANVDSWYRLNSCEEDQKTIDQNVTVRIEKKRLEKTLGRGRFSWFKKLFQLSFLTCIVFVVNAQNKNIDLFTKLMGVSSKSQSYAKFISSINEKPNVKYYPKEYKNQDWTYVSFYGKGFEIMIVDSRVHQIFFHNKKNSKFTTFSQPLPYGLFWFMKKDEVHARLGSPTCIGGGGEFLGEKVLFWDKYGYSKYSLNVIYNDNDEVYEICLTEINCTKKQ